MELSECRMGAGVGIRRLVWLVPHRGVRLRCAQMASAKGACGGECAAELLEGQGGVSSAACG
jgi:hypothetical protein